MTDHEKHRSRFQDRKNELDRRRKYSEFKRRQYEKLGESDAPRSADIISSGETDEDLLAAFLRHMRSIREPGEIDLPKSIDVFGNDVFTLTWDAGGTNNGTWWVINLGPYYFCNIDSGTFGPFASLERVLQSSEMTTVTSVTESIKSSELSAGELANILSAAEEIEQGFQLQINDETWELNWRGTWPRSSGRD